MILLLVDPKDLVGRTLKDLSKLQSKLEAGNVSPAFDVIDTLSRNACCFGKVALGPPSLFSQFFYAVLNGTHTCQLCLTDSKSKI